jgi:hypothetical protein
MTDGERLIRIETKLDKLITEFDNHLVHHFRYNILAWGVALTAIIGLLLK